jgi:hydroxymethylbilane synthase
MMRQSNSLERIRIGTRGSALALAQARRVAELIVARRPDIATELVIVETEGDIDQTSSLTEIGGRGVFTSAVQAQLLAGRIDIAVHSAKDLPARSPDGLAIVAVPEREDPRDVLVSRHAVCLSALPAGPRIGTSSRRRAMEVLGARPDAVIVDLRGNVDTRLRKAETETFDAIVLAAAGLGRLGLLHRVTEWLPVDRFVPAPGQGALAVEARTTDAPVVELLREIDDPVAAAAVAAERALLDAIGAGCTVPLGAHVAHEQGVWTLHSVYGEESTAVQRIKRVLDSEHLVEGARLAAQELLAGRSSRGAEAAGRPRVLVTRAAAQAAPLSAALAAAGMEPVEYPVIRIAPPDVCTPLDRALEGVMAGDFDWVIFTSANAVDGVASRLQSAGLPKDTMKRVRLAAVGRATADALAAQDWPVALVARESSGYGLVADLAGTGVAGHRVLYPHGDLARDQVASGLAAAGAEVVPVVAYRTLPEDRPSALDRDLWTTGIDAVTFASPSSIRNLATRMDGLDVIAGARIVCVGPVTAEAARQHGLDVHAIADDASVDGMVAAVRAAMAGVESRNTGNGRFPKEQRA